MDAKSVSLGLASSEGRVNSARICEEELMARMAVIVLILGAFLYGMDPDNGNEVAFSLVSWQACCPGN